MPPSAAPASVLVVDDEAGMREFLEIALRRAGHEVHAADGGAAALTLLDRHAFDVVVTDLTMPGIGGMEVLRHAGTLADPPLVVVITAFASTETAIAAMKAGAYDYLTKPFKLEEIQIILSRALERRRLSAENRLLRDELRGVASLERMVGRSAPMQRVFELVRRVAATRSNVLVCGESGTGKELVARALHSLSDRKAAPFVAVNCGAIPAELMESELFGHVRGSFTGASRDHEGVFAAAHGGVLFLDEVAELAPNLQVKLLRVLQERTVRPVGSSKEQAVDCRVVAATNRDLEAAIAAGEFRQDLFFRLDVVRIVLPPLRERREDIPLLVERFFERCCRELGRPLRGISPPAMEAFLRHHYPGNVRELENLVERAVALEAGDVLGAEHLPGPRPNPVGEGAAELPPEGTDLDAALAAVERRFLEQALGRSGGVRREAARLLRITVRSLRYRLEKLGMSVSGPDDPDAEMPSG